jgi:hypothetical protein
MSFKQEHILQIMESIAERSTRDVDHIQYQREVESVYPETFTIHKPSFSGWGYIISSPDKTGVMVSWGICLKGWVSAQHTVCGFLDDHRKTISPFLRFSDIQIECVDFNKEVPVRKSKPYLCKNTNFAENLTNNNSWRVCKSCEIFHVTHWYISPEDNHPPTDEDRAPLPGPPLTPELIRTRKIADSYMGLHTPSFSGIGYIILSPDCRYYLESWGKCFRTFDEARAAVSERFNDTCIATPWCDVQIKRVNFSYPVHIQQLQLWDGCHNTNQRKNTSGSFNFKECGDCYLSGRPRHWYIHKEDIHNH